MMPEKYGCIIRLEPFGLRFEAKPGTNLAYFLREQGIPLRSDCGGKGLCGKCVVNVSSPNHLKKEAQASLACRTEVAADLLVDVPLSSLVSPSEAVDKAIDFESYPPRFEGVARRGFGLAIDLGTTTMAGFLCDYTKGTVVSSAVAPNPQSVYGADVMSRITAAASDPKHLRLLNLLAVSAVNEIALSLIQGSRADPETVGEIVVVGNSTMLHLFLGFNPESLGQSPFRPLFRAGQQRTAPEIGLTLNSHARVFTLPLISGFVGADLVSAALAQRMREHADGTMLIDIGTNGEIILKANGRFYATSCATGPAFEGASIAHGMLAVSGAIDSFCLDPLDGSSKYTVIQQRADSPIKVRGICGSGLISIAAALIRCGIIESSGRFNPHAVHPNLRLGPQGTAEFVVARSHETEGDRDVVLTQKDIRALQLAKGAIFTGIDMLCRSAGCGFPKEMILAGSFGSHLEVDDLLTIGLLQWTPTVRIRMVGNAAGAGAVMAAIDQRLREEASTFADQVEVVELASQPAFQKIFLDSLSFPGEGKT
jgi:uncharacterized 2Fe-2S/4Fe-4S cluster protein (DUF4445 family)